MKEEGNQDPQIYDTHKFLYTLFYENKIKNHEVTFIDRNSEEKTIVLKDIEISSSPISCKLYDLNNNKYLVPFLRIRKIFKGNEMVWDNTQTDLSNTKIIKGYK